MSTRQRLPDRRCSEVISFEHDGSKYVGRAARYSDGHIAEIFLDGGGKIGMPVYMMSKDAAVAVSFALQYGAPLEALMAAMSQERDGTMRGPVGRFLQLLVESES